MIDIDYPQNTRQMSMEPDSPDQFVMMDRETGGGKAHSLLPVFSGDAFRKVLNYPVIVESWEHKKAGRVKREWEKEFTQAERNKIARYYARFYRWYLVSGTPKRVTCRVATLRLLQRAVAFFASV